MRFSNLFRLQILTVFDWYIKKHNTDCHFSMSIIGINSSIIRIISEVSKLFPSRRIPYGNVANSRDILATTSKPHVSIIRDMEKSWTSTHINTGEAQNTSGYGRKENQKHQRFIRIEIDHYVIRIVRVVKARENGSSCVISSVTSIKVVKFGTFFTKPIRTTFHVEFQFGFIVESNIHFVICKKFLVRLIEVELGKLLLTYFWDTIFSVFT